MKITLATGNKHKVEEINLIAKDFGIEFVLPEGEFDPVEDGTTFLQNAYCKALCASKAGNTELYLADDSGLCVDALDGAPGLKSARYAPTADERIDKLLKALENVKDKSDRTAHFTCAMVIVNKKGEILYQVQKDCNGYILNERHGAGGFGYDPIFFVNSENKGMAELTAEQKAKVSHRAKSLNCVLEWLKKYTQKIEVGKTYKHYKGNLYKIIALAKHSETMEDMIVYSSLDGEKIWTRPAKMWSEKVDNQGTLRFMPVEE